ncbi:MAG TPA: hypothetical protein VMT54_07055 [Candidatus Cybelea sp.]|nr:hypothetical protein [Candidatus Cybelea sp.]
MLTRFAASLVVLAALSAPALACTQQEAVDKMTKLATALGQKASQATTQDDSNKIVAANEKVNEGGTALGNGDYDKACSIYDQVAKDNGITLQ